jgi:tetratricopeptide (TPR) repeat protein
MTHKGYRFFYGSVLIFFLFTAFTFAQERKSSKSLNDYLAFSHFVNGTLYELSGDLNSAIQEYIDGLNYSPDSYTLRFSLAQDYFKLGDIEKALKEADEIELKTGEIWAFMGDCYRGLNKKVEAIASYSKAVQIDSNLIAPYWFLAQVWQQAGEIDSAIYAWRKVASGSPFSKSIYLNLGFLLETQGRLEEALQEYKRASNVDPHDKKALLSIGGVYEAQKDFTQAIRIYQEALTLDTNDVLVRTKLVQLYFNSGDREKALDEGIKLYELLPQDKNIKRLLGGIYLSLQKYPQAETLFSEYIKADSTDPGGYLFLGRTFLEEKKYPQAKTMFQRTIALNDSLSGSGSVGQEAWVSLGITYLEEDSLYQAKEIFSQALSMVEKKDEIYYFLGLVYSRQKEFPLAIEALLKADSLNSENIQVLFLLGSAYEQSKNFEVAVSTFEKVLSINPENDEALNYLGYILADKGIRLDEALKMIEKALEKKPENGAYLDSYGWILFRLGKVNEAEIQIRKALKTQFKDAVLYEHLGDILDASGRKEEARQQWEKALELNPENEKIKAKLGK